MIAEVSAVKISLYFAVPVIPAEPPSAATPAVILYFAFALPVTSRSLPLARLAAGILMISASELTAEGLPLTVIFAWVSSVRLTLWLKPAGRLVIQSPESVDAKVSFASVIITSLSAIAVPVVPSMLTSSTTAVGAADSCTNLRTVVLLAASYSPS